MYSIKVVVSSLPNPKHVFTEGYVLYNFMSIGRYRPFLECKAVFSSCKINKKVIFDFGVPIFT